MNIFPLYDKITKLKKTTRKGWLLRGITEPESVADHSFGVAVLTFYLAQKLGYDAERCLEIAVLHDLAESITKDITPHDNVSKLAKEKLEYDAIAKISEEIGEPRFKELVLEYLRLETKEAKLVHDADKLEMVLQALDYEKDQPDANLEEFFLYVKDRLILEESKRIFSQIQARRS